MKPPLKKHYSPRPLKYHGGKQSMLQYILPVIPRHLTYVEPFAGGLSVFFAKAQVQIEVINDTNKQVINLYKVLQTKFEELQDLFKTALVSESLHKDARIMYNNPHLFTDVQCAWALLILSRPSNPHNLNGAFFFSTSISGERKAGTQIEYVKKSLSEGIKKRIEGVQILCREALDIIPKFNKEEAFIYCDPPYIGTAQGHYKGYTEEDFIKLLDELSKLKAKFLLSSFPSKVLDTYIKKHGWHHIKKDVLGDLTKKTKTECLTANYDLECQKNLLLNSN